MKYVRHHAYLGRIVIGVEQGKAKRDIDLPPIRIYLRFLLSERLMRGKGGLYLVVGDQHRLGGKVQ